MDQETLDVIVTNLQKAQREILCSKAEDYAGDDERLDNFKKAAGLSGEHPLDCLRGMWRKHIISIEQGLQDLRRGHTRDLGWWYEKLMDDYNYNVLFHALLHDTLFYIDQPPDEED